MKIKSKFDVVRKDNLGLFSFVNLSSLILLNKIDVKDYVFYSDGFLLTFLLSKFKSKSVTRFSFDFTSVADDVFKNAIKFDRTLIIKGEELAIGSKFVELIKIKYPKINIVYFDGYNNNWETERDIIAEYNKPIIIVGLGSGLQEEYGLFLSQRKNDFLLFTCGGFIRQTVLKGSSLHYYPKFFDKYNLRFLYRMINEPYTIKRYLIDYPINILYFIKIHKLIRVI